MQRFLILARDGDDLLRLRMSLANADLPSDPDALRAFALAGQAELKTAELSVQLRTLEIEKLKFQIAKLRRMQFGRSPNERSPECRGVITPSVFCHHATALAQVHLGAGRQKIRRSPRATHPQAAPKQRPSDFRALAPSDSRKFGLSRHLLPDPPAIGLAEPAAALDFAPQGPSLSSRKASILKPIKPRSMVPVLCGAPLRERPGAENCGRGRLNSGGTALLSSDGIIYALPPHVVDRLPRFCRLRVSARPSNHGV
jgi:hypothetical protein